MEKINLHFRFNVFDLMYGKFLTVMGDNGISFSSKTLTDDNLTLSVCVDAEVASMMKLKFGYFEFTPIVFDFNPSWYELNFKEFATVVDVVPTRSSFFQKFLNNVKKM